MTCRVCHDTGTYYVPDGDDCVSKEPCDNCEAFNDRIQRKANA